MSAFAACMHVQLRVRLIPSKFICTSLHSHARAFTGVLIRLQPHFTPAVNHEPKHFSPAHLHAHSFFAGLIARTPFCLHAPPCAHLLGNVSHYWHTGTPICPCPKWHECLFLSIFIWSCAHQLACFRPHLHSMRAHSHPWPSSRSLFACVHIHMQTGLRVEPVRKPIPRHEHYLARLFYSICEWHLIGSTFSAMQDRLRT